MAASRVPTNILMQSLQTYVDCGSGWEASFELGYSDSVVNRHVRQLEDRCGFFLLQRDESGRRVPVLTQEGRDVLASGIGYEKKEAS